VRAITAVLTVNSGSSSCPRPKKLAIPAAAREKHGEIDGRLIVDGE
jgi:hypothetical protein